MSGAAPQQLDPTEAKRVGDVIIARSTPATSPEWMDTPCLLWTGALFRDGYGAIRAGGTTMKATRAAWMAFVGPIGLDGLGRTLEVHVKCRVKTCVNPAHHELLTRTEIRVRQCNRLTHCPNNHERTPENTMVRPPSNRGLNPSTTCRLCARDAKRRYMRKKRAAKKATSQRETQAERAHTVPRRDHHAA